LLETPFEVEPECVIPKSNPASHVPLFLEGGGEEEEEAIGVLSGIPFVKSNGCMGLFNGSAYNQVPIQIKVRPQSVHCNLTLFGLVFPKRYLI
jgi:hypothetical protein